MNTTLTFSAKFAIAIVALGGIGCEDPIATTQAPQESHASPLEATYIVEGRSIALHAGRHAEPVAPGSAAMATTAVWGEPTTAGDLDQDGRDDAVVILVSESGGSGTFHYVAAAYNAGANVRRIDRAVAGRPYRHAANRRC